MTRNKHETKVLLAAISVAALVFVVPAITAASFGPGALVPPRESSTTISTAELTETSPIVLDGNAAMATFPNKTGNGIQGDPYVISGYHVIAGGAESCIVLKNMDVHVLITGCMMSGANREIRNRYNGGLLLENVSNVVVEDSLLDDNSHGISVTFSQDIVITGVAVENSNRPGIMIAGSTGVLVNGSTVTGSYHGIFVHDSTNVNVTGCELENIITTGVLVQYSTSVNVVSNTIKGCTAMGVFIERSASATVVGNQIQGCAWDGIGINSNGTTVSGNQVRDCLLAGIMLYVAATGNTVTGNTLTNNAKGVVDRAAAGSNTVSENAVANAFPALMDPYWSVFIIAMVVLGLIVAAFIVFIVRGKEDEVIAR